MIKLNNKGFVLIEILVSAVFVLALFSIVYSNFVPLIGEYEKREIYDDIDSKYGTYWIKRIIQSESVNFKGVILNNINTNFYHQFTCEDVTDSATKNVCENLVKSLDIEKDSDGTSHIYITRFSLGNFNANDHNNFKSVVSANKGDKFTSGLQDYVGYLPAYSKIESLNDANYRVIVEFLRSNGPNEYRTYATFEIKK